MNLDKIGTERINEETGNIDILSTVDIIKLINKEDKKISEAVGKENLNISKLVDEIVNCFNNGGRLIYVGAGTSGRLGVLDASECPPTFSVGPSMVMGIIAGGDYALRFSKEGVEDDPDLAKADLEKINLKKEDIVVGVSASGRSPYVVGGILYANSLKCKTGSISCSYNGEISKYSNISIEVDTGPEVISGSTRMKAGTAQKLILNMLSTVAMIKMGKVYKNYMVDVATNNKKLVERAKRMVVTITGCSYNRAQDLLKTTNDNVKLAVLMEITNLDVTPSRKLLNENNGFLRAAIKNSKN